MRLAGASERVRRIAIVVVAATGAALVLWRLWPGQPVPRVPGLPPDHPAGDGPSVDEAPAAVDEPSAAAGDGPAVDEPSATREGPASEEPPRADVSPNR